MKVIGVNASPRGKDSNTLKLTNAVLAGAKEEGAETEFIDLYTLRIEYCTACGTCYATGECTLLDDFSDLFDRIMNADGIVLGAPNYIDCRARPDEGALRPDGRCNPLPDVDRANSGARSARREGPARRRSSGT